MSSVNWVFLEVELEHLWNTIIIPDKWDIGLSAGKSGVMYD